MVLIRKPPSVGRRLHSVGCQLTSFALGHQRTSVTLSGALCVLYYLQVHMTSVQSTSKKQARWEPGQPGQRRQEAGLKSSGFLCSRPTISKPPGHPSPHPVTDEQCETLIVLGCSHGCLCPQDRAVLILRQPVQYCSHPSSRASSRNGIAHSRASSMILLHQWDPREIRWNTSTVGGVRERGCCLSLKLTWHRRTFILIPLPPSAPSPA